MVICLTVPNRGAGHRRDIDGLRAVAVSGVILDHAGVPGFSAGFSGVDIFFVISGFLIGGIVLKALAEGRFSFREFYARRARRILPALFVMILVTLPFALTMMIPRELRHYGGGAFATIIFLSNVWFLKRIDYFNPEAASDPLLHTWSLAVEEQFYLVLPILLILLWCWQRLRAQIGTVLVIVSAASFLVAVFSPPEQTMDRFYLSHTRAWELLSGVLAAMAYQRAQTLTGRVRGGLAAAGLLLTLASITVIPDPSGWPGVWTLIPVVGASLVLLFGDQASAARRLLSLPPMVWLGAISYSAYLWHQPILGFLAISDNDLRGPLQTAAFLCATLALACTSWRFIEQPFRHQKLPPRFAQWMMAGMAVAIATFAVAAHVSNGFPQRLPEKLQVMVGSDLDKQLGYRNCIGARRSFEKIQPEKACVLGAGEPASIAIWGDSHAAVLGGPLAARLATHGLSVRMLTMAGCSPVLQWIHTKKPEYVICQDHNRRMYDYLLKDTDIKVVILHAYWNDGIQRNDYDNGIGDRKSDAGHVINLGDDEDEPDEVRYSHLAESLQTEVQTLKAAGKQVIVVGPVPEPGFNVLDRLAKQYWTDGRLQQPLTIPAKAALDYAAPARRILMGAASKTGAIWIDPAPLFCSEGGDCALTTTDKSLYFDDNHLAIIGVERLVPQLEQAILGALAP